MTGGITVEELFAALEQAESENGEGFTIAELREQTGIGLSRARALIGAAIRVGKIRTSQKWITAISGRKTLVPSYVLVE